MYAEHGAGGPLMITRPKVRESPSEQMKVQAREAMSWCNTGRVRIHPALPSAGNAREEVPSARLGV